MTHTAVDGKRYRGHQAADGLVGHHSAFAIPAMVLVLLAPGSAGAQTHFDHSAFDRLLHAHVDSGLDASGGEMEHM